MDSPDHSRENVDPGLDGQVVRYPIPAVIPPVYTVGYHHADYLKRYKECLVRYPMYLTLKEVQKFQASPLDIVVCSQPRTGTTWLSSIITGILAEGDRSVYRDGVPMSTRWNFLCYCDPLQPEERWPVNLLRKMPPGRNIYTHLSYDALPSSLAQGGAKKVYIYRNPKDTVVATYYHLVHQPRVQFKGDLMDVVESFVNDSQAFGPYFLHLASYWKRRGQDPNIFICSFEDLKNDFKPTVARLAKYLGKNLSPEQIGVIHRETDFKAAQANPALNKIERHVEGIFDFNKHPFVRNGSIGQWKKEFTPAMNSKMDSWIERKMIEHPELRGMKFVYE
ncbi:putative Sulfotransferase family cytosolic 1B member 1 [Hypsibius exemplaris]|uniref:Sulfotransferase family cytosolic 1B member 1 n=1 Tax=Hypsibius exemplaris TaxID=2072580 RepID=A0A1W0X736_HYPEX|nr:putative Sulfotransferase family cytosolic 1B member 1 [Hypsibius exemplaris]